MSDNVLPGRWLLAMQGPPGSGKSTLGQAVSRRLEWPLIDKDDVRDLLDDTNPGLSYDIMFNVARRQLRQGLSVIADSPLGYRRTYERAARIADESGATLAIIACYCPDEDLWRRRIAARQGLPLPTHHTTDWATVQDFLRRTAVEGGWSMTHPRLCVDTTRPVSELCAEVVAWLARQRGESAPTEETTADTSTPQR